MAVSWLSYVPVPGTAFLAVWAAPEDPLTRFHAWQGGTLVAAAYAVVIGLGFLVRVSDATVYQAIMGAVTLAAVIAILTGIGLGIVGAVRGQYVRVRPVWDLVSALKE